MSNYMNIPVRVTDLSVRECVLYANLHLRGERADSIGTRLTVKINEEFDRWLAERDARIAREAAEKAWDEGFTRGFYSGQWMGPDADASESPHENPYRQRLRA